MALESPAYVISADQHSASLFRQTLQALIEGTGVVGPGDLATTQNGTPNMSVNVAAGVLILPGSQGGTTGMPVNQGSQNATYSSLLASLTNQGVYAAYNDAVANQSIAASNPTNPRIDLITACVQDAQYSGSFNQVIFSVVTGTAAVSPVAPTPPLNSVVISQIAVAANATTIVNANITDERPLLTLGRLGYQQAAITTTTNSVNGWVNLAQLTLPAGTWYLVGKADWVTVSGSSSSGELGIGPTSASATGMYCSGSATVGASGTGGARTRMECAGVVTLAAATTVYLQQGATAANQFATQPTGVVSSANIGSGITAIRLA
jgi:hypothetical protein